MRRIRPVLSSALALLVIGSPALAQTEGDSPLPERMERALRDMLEGVRPSLEGALDYMHGFGAIDDPRNYQLPEILPNGDIIIRRREDAPAFSPDPPTEPDTEPPADVPDDPEGGIRT